MNILGGAEGTFQGRAQGGQARDNNRVMALNGVEVHWHNTVKLRIAAAGRPRRLAL